MVQYLAQGYFDVQTWVAGESTNNISIGGWTVLTPEPQPRQAGTELA